MRLPQVGMIWDRRVARIEPLRRRVEKVESVADDTGNDLGGGAAPREPLAHAEESSGPSDGAKNGVGVDRLDRAEVDDLDVPAFLGELASGLKTFVHHRAIGDKSGVSPELGDARFSDR